MGPFLTGAGNGGFVGEEFLELAADGGCVVVAGDFAFQFIQGDVLIVAFVRLRGFGFGGGFGGRGVGVDVLFVRLLFRRFGRGFGVWLTAIGGGFGPAGTGCCFGHFTRLTARFIAN